MTTYFHVLVVFILSLSQCLTQSEQSANSIPPLQQGVEKNKVRWPEPTPNAPFSLILKPSKKLVVGKILNMPVVVRNDIKTDIIIETPVFTMFIAKVTDLQGREITWPDKYIVHDIFGYQPTYTRLEPKGIWKAPAFLLSRRIELMEGTYLLTAMLYIRGKIGNQDQSWWLYSSPLKIQVMPQKPVSKSKEDAERCAECMEHW